MARRNWRRSLLAVAERLGRSGHGVLEEIGKSLIEHLGDETVSKEMIIDWMRDVVDFVDAAGRDVFKALADPKDWIPRR